MLNFEWWIDGTRTPFFVSSIFIDSTLYTLHMYINVHAECRTLFHIPYIHVLEMYSFWIQSRDKNVWALGLWCFPVLTCDGSFSFGSFFISSAFSMSRFTFMSVTFLSQNSAFSVQHSMFKCILYFYILTDFSLSCIIIFWILNSGCIKNQKASVINDCVETGDFFSWVSDHWSSLICLCLSLSLSIDCRL